jgi:uncharacterized protein
VAHVDPSVAELVRRFLVRLGDEGIRVDAAYLFGSIAAGTSNQWSDIDVAVISPDMSEDRFAERVRLTGFSSSIDVRIEPVPFRPDNFIDEDPLAWEIRRRGISVDVG